MEIKEKIRECFKSALKDEEKGKKHKGLLITEPNQKEAERYLEKARESLEFCDLYKKMEADYKIPEEWFYSLYYCALAILSKFGVETRSQRCTALFIRYVKEKGLIDYNEEFIDKITVHKEIGKESSVDEREKARYGSEIKMNEIIDKYNDMMNICKEAISQCEELIFSNEKLEIPEEIKELLT